MERTEWRMSNGDSDNNLLLLHLFHSRFFAAPFFAATSLRVMSIPLFASLLRSIIFTLARSLYKCFFFHTPFVSFAPIHKSCLMR